MKTKNVFWVLFLLICMGEGVYGQKIQGKAFYASKRSTQDMNFESSEMSPEMIRALKAQISKAFERDYVLEFNSQESIFSQVEKLSNNPMSGGNMNVVVSDGTENAKIYKNIKGQNYVSQREILGKQFLIKDSLKNYKWVLEDEQKKIGNYTCHKAKIVFPVTDEEMKIYEEMKKKNEGKTTFMELSEPKEHVIEAWYTLDIPISNGPELYYGLPGLILELHDDGRVYLCTKIILNKGAEMVIKAPSSGKLVTQKEFNKIQKEKMESMNKEGNFKMEFH